MASAALDAVLITSEANFRYFSGFASQTWVAPTRPRYLILPRAAEPIAVVPTSNVKGMCDTTPVRDVRSWQAPRPEDDGISLVQSALRDCTSRFGTIGAELGHESRLGMPAGDLLRLIQQLRPIEVSDAMPLIARQRTIKSPSEIERIRRIATIASDAFAALPQTAAGCASVRDVCQRLQADLLLRGADKTPYLVGEAGNGGYETIMMGPNDRRLRPGDVVFIDTGSVYDGYFCDFDRHFAVGTPADSVRQAYDAVYAATDAGFAALRPGRRTREVWHAMAESLGRQKAEASPIGRMGHGIGLSLTEQPSIHSADETLLVPGMVITLEPSMSYRVSDTSNASPKLMVHEENIVITDDGYELLSRRAPPEIPLLEIEGAA
jgi:Xaa-Pro dipeptidase